MRGNRIMEYYKVNCGELDGLDNLGNSLKNILHQCSDTVNGVKRGLSSQASVSRYCDMVSKAASSLEKNAEKAKKMNYAMKKISAVYADYEKQVVGKIENLPLAQITSKNKVKNMATGGAATAVTMSSGTKAKDLIKQMWNSEVDKSRNGEKVSTETFSRSRNSKSKSGFIGVGNDGIRYTKQTDYISLEGKATGGKNYGKASGEYNMETEHFDWKTNDLQGTATLNGTKAYVSGEVDIAKGNVYGKAGLEYTLAGGTIHAGGNSALQFDLGGSAGIGGSVKAGISDGKFTANISAAFGLGGSFGFTIDYRQIGKVLKDAFTFDQPFFPWG